MEAQPRSGASGSGRFPVRGRRFRSRLDRGQGRLTRLGVRGALRRHVGQRLRGKRGYLDVGQPDHAAVRAPVRVRPRPRRQSGAGHPVAITPGPTPGVRRQRPAAGGRVEAVRRAPRTALDPTGRRRPPRCPADPVLERPDPGCRAAGRPGMGFSDRSTPSRTPTALPSWHAATCYACSPRHVPAPASGLCRDRRIKGPTH